MADLRDERGARGQILLIAAFTLAVIFVALALVVNSAIFTENLASRGEIAGGSDALTYRHLVEESVGEAIAFANVYNHSGPGSPLEDSLKESVSDVGTQGGNHSAMGGQLVNVSFVASSSGSRIADNDSGGSTFESATGGGDWQLADDVERTRRIHVRTSRSDLPGSEGTSFTLHANRSGTDDGVWNVSIWEDGSNAVLKVQTPGGDEATCRRAAPFSEQFDIDVTGGVVNGERCHALTREGPNGEPRWFAAGITAGAPYNVTVENGGNIEGNFSMVVAPQGSWNDTHLNDGHDPLNPAEPYRTDAVYGATVEYVFRTTQVTYETEIEVVPGEPP